MGWHPLRFRLVDFGELEEELHKRCSVNLVGRSQEGRPIYHYALGTGPLKLFIVAGIHGTEPAPVHACVLLPEILSQRFPLGFNVERLESVEVHVIPLANPDGFSLNFRRFQERGFAPHWAHVWEDARFTACGEDINGDWMRLSLPETQAIHRAFNEINPHVVLDLHEFYAKGGCPPRWAEETEGFRATLTDTPYRWVSAAVQKISQRLAQVIAERIDWKPKMQHFTAGGGENFVAPPNVLGTHFPYEGAAKVLVETWGVALGPYLLSERVMIHLQAILAVLEFMEKQGAELLAMRETWKKEEMEIGHKYAGFLIRGEDIKKAEEILSGHAIAWERRKDGVFVPMPQERSRMALLLLDEDCEHNRALAEQNRGPHTLNRFLKVEIERKGVIS